MDKQLILEKIKHSDKSAFNELFLHYYNRLCRFAYVILNCEHMAEEVVQDTFAKLWEKRKSLTISSNLDSYLFIAVRNASLNSVKNTQIRKKSIGSDEYITEIETDPFNNDAFLKSSKERYEKISYPVLLSPPYVPAGIWRFVKHGLV